ncbi:MAG: insulinase family protein [Deltaproteobacteria bacterium]|nr:insulinase family protein [Deltaproteobacteria bacterium]
MKQDFKQAKLSNGITVIGEYLPNASSASFAVLVPVGAISDPVSEQGINNILAEMFYKGAAGKSSRQISDLFEDIGASRGHSPGIEISVFSSSVLTQHLPRVLELYAQVLLSPELAAEELDSAKELALQELKHIEDNPSQKVMIELAKQYYPDPFGRSSLGNEAGIRAISAKSLKDFYQAKFVASNVAIVLAGKFDFDQILQKLESSYGYWQGSGDLLSIGAFKATDKKYHIEQNSSQLQIALAYPSVGVEHPQYYAARIACGLLSGGMAGRLFIEVREKRGLVYSVSASHSAAKGRAAVLVYAGTTPERGQETLDVMITELKNLAKNITAEELKRAKADIKARLLINAENTSLRASALINDWWNLGRLRELDEIKANIDAVQISDIEAHLAQYPVQAVTMVTLGNRQLELVV